MYRPLRIGWMRPPVNSGDYVVMEKRPWWGQEGGCEPGPVLLAKYVDHGLSAILGVGFTKNGPGKYLSMDFAEHCLASTMNSL
jgi:hypothetical protein